MVACLGNATAGTFGIIGSDMDGERTVKTDSSWKCTDQYEDNWSECSFDDFNWPNAVVLQINESQLFQEIEMLPSESENTWIDYKLYRIAEWIWTEGDSDVAYCRKRLLPGEF